MSIDQLYQLIMRKLGEFPLGSIQKSVNFSQGYSIRDLDNQNILKYRIFPKVIQGGCQTLKTLKALGTLNQTRWLWKPWKTNIFQWKTLRNLKMRVYYRESSHQCFSSETLSTKFRCTETNHCITFIFRCTGNVT